MSILEPRVVDNVLHASAAENLLVSYGSLSLQGGQCFLRVSSLFAQEKLMIFDITSYVVDDDF